MSDSDGARGATRAKITNTAASLLREHGPAGVTTRRVADRAGVQQPTIYRLFGDKDGLLDAVAEHVMAQFADAKAEDVQAAAADDIDPVVDLRTGWDAMIAFGVANPALFRLLSDPTRVARSPAAQTGHQALQARVHRVAVAGRLGVGESRAVAMIQAAGTGAIQTLLATPAERRDPALADAMYGAVLAQILDGAEEASHRDALTAAVTIRAITPDLTMLTPAERHLLDDWLARIIDAS